MALRRRGHVRRRVKFRLDAEGFTRKGPASKTTSCNAAVKVENAAAERGKHAMGWAVWNGGRHLRKGRKGKRG